MVIQAWTHCAGGQPAWYWEQNTIVKYALEDAYIETILSHEPHDSLLILL